MQILINSEHVRKVESALSRIKRNFPNHLIIVEKQNESQHRIRTKENFAVLQTEEVIVGIQQHLQSNGIEFKSRRRNPVSVSPENAKKVSGLLNFFQKKFPFHLIGIQLRKGETNHRIIVRRKRPY
ncbi:MAG: hypothetical protein ABIA76_05130 [Candidatus Diapherotrites archaeon]